MFHVPLVYDPRFSKLGVWMLNALSNGIRARVPFDHGEILVDREVRWHRTREECAFDAMFVHPLSCEQWISEPVALHRDMLKCQLVLRYVPPTIDYALRQL